MKKLIFVGYNLTEGTLEETSMVSGEIKNANYLMRGLKYLGVDVTPVSIDLYNDQRAKVKHSITKSNSKGFLRWITEAKYLNKLLNQLIKENPNASVYLTIPSYLPFLNLPKDTNVIVTAHGTYWPELLADLKYESNIIKKLFHMVNGYVQLMIDKKAFQKARFLHSVSDFQIEEMVNTYKISESKIQSIRNGTDFKNLPAEKSFDLIWVGRLAKKKNIKLLREVKEKFPDIRICIVGGNDYFAIDQDSMNIVKELMKDSSVVNYSDVSDGSLNHLMTQSKILVVTSTGYESIPTVIFEGLASGCAVLSPNSWGVNEVEGKGLYLYKEGDVHSLLEMLDTVQSNENLIASLDESVRWENRAAQFKGKFNL